MRKSHKNPKKAKSNEEIISNAGTGGNVVVIPGWNLDHRIEPEATHHKIFSDIHQVRRYDNRELSNMSFNEIFSRPVSKRSQGATAKESILPTIPGRSNEYFLHFLF